MLQGREWEVLVAQLEALFAGPAFTVTSPDNIRSRRTGNIVKVDVTVRGRVGAQEVLIAFECRDRADHQGVDWIQQLATRKQDIGASELVAVSRDGFTADAAREAEAHGISLRTLASVDSNELASFVLELSMDLDRRRYQARRVDFRQLRVRPFGIDRAAWPEFTPEHLQDVMNRPEDRILHDKLTGNAVSVIELVHAADWDAAFRGERFAGKRAHVAPLSKFTDQWGHEQPRLRYWLDSGHGVDIDGLAFEGDVWWETESVQLSRLLRYSTSDNALAAIAEFDLSPHGFAETIQVFLGRAT